MRSFRALRASIFGSHGGIPLSLYLAGLILIFVLTGAASAFFVRSQAAQQADREARAETQFAANLAASEVAAGVTQIEATIARTAANPAIASIFTPGTPCNVAFGGAGVFQKTHLEFILPNGTVTCSSAGPTPAGVSYSGAAWLQDALRGPVLVAPVLDPRTGRVSMVSAAPSGDRGVVAGFAELTDLGQTLSARFGGPSGLEFVVTSADGKTALARSVDGARWSGASIEGTSFAKTTEQTRLDLDNTLRVYGAATAGARGWNVYAGAAEAAVASNATDLFLRDLAVTTVGLVAVLIATLLVYRGVIGPVHALGRSVSTTDPARATPIPVTGPSEIATLARDFNGLIATVHKELAERGRSEATTRAMLDASLSAIVGMDEQGNVVEWSRQAEAMFGWKRSEVVGRLLASLIIPERYRARHIAGLDRYLRTGVGPVLGTRLELEALARDGREFPVELSITVTETTGGRFFTAFIRDISERHTSERQRLGLEERLRQSERLEGIGRLAGGIAHDFNNILAVVMNYSQFVEDSLPADSDVRDDVVQIRLAAERGATFTRQLLTFAHRGAISPQETQLNTVVGELRTMLRRTIPESVTIDLRLSPDLWTVRIDVGQLEQLLLNLVVNAADAMPDGGTVLLSTTNVEFDPENAEAAGVTAGPFVRLDVTDTGYGMSKDVIARAFEPFFTTKPKGKGTGLGLATAYGIVQQAFGAISIESVVGKGTTLRVLLPAQVGVQPEATRIRVASTPDAEPSKAVVLVVEDEAAVRKAVIRILSDRGYGTLQAAGPTSAMEVARLWSGPVDLLVTDIVMPEMSGDELARELRKGRPHLRVMYMTGYSGELDNAALRIDGPVVQKPFTRDALLAAVEETLAGIV
jgi:PAS domain S-box-containing protein